MDWRRGEEVWCVVSAVEAWLGCSGHLSEA